MKTEFFKGLDAVDHYDELKSFDWIDNFLKIPDVQKKISALKIEHRQIQTLPPLKEDFKNRLKVDYEKIQKARITWLKKYLQEVMDHENPLEYYNLRSKHHQGGAKFAPYVNWAEIEAAFDLIPEGEGAISSQKKEKQLHSIDKQLAELQVELNRISPPHFFIQRGGRIIGDKRKLFITAWQTLQAQMSEPCSSHGYALAKSPKAEQNAWGKLFLSQDVNPLGKFVPDQGEK